jgi:hypothetical protein
MSQQVNTDYTHHGLGPFIRKERAQVQGGVIGKRNGQAAIRVVLIQLLEVTVVVRSDAFTFRQIPFIQTLSSRC